jgi:CheY-like chemotaxis protein
LANIETPESTRRLRKYSLKDLRHIREGAIEQQVLRIDREVYTSGQIARLLRIPDRTVRRYLSIGRIEGYQHPITGTWQIERKALLRFIEDTGGDPTQFAKTQKILIVDDDPPIVDRLKKELSDSLPDAIIDATADACDALIEIGECCPDIVILKARMPVLTGKDILAAMRNNLITAHVKALVLGELREELEELMQNGADETLLVPFSEESLKSKVEHLLSSTLGDGGQSPS